MKQPRSALVPVFLLMAGSCGDTGIKAPDASLADAAPSPECIAAADHSDLEWLEKNVFRRSCAGFSACHKGSALSAGGLNLESGNVAASLVGEPSIEFPAKTLVVKGDPDNSYLMVLLGSRQGDLPEAGNMPFNSGLLCRPKREAIERWIVSLDDVSADAGVEPDAKDNTSAQ